MDYVESAERLSRIPAAAVLSVVILGALFILVLLVYALRNSGTAGLTNAIDSLSDALKASSDHQAALEREFNQIVLSIEQITVVLKDIQSMKDDIGLIKVDTKDNAANTQEILRTYNDIKTRLERLEEYIVKIVAIVDEKADKNEK